MKLPRLSFSKSLRGVRVLVRVSWNVPLSGRSIDTESLKIQRSLETVDRLSKRGAIVIVMTHLGRPKRKDPKLSTRQLARAIQKQEGIPITFLPDAVDTVKGVARIREVLAEAKPGEIFLLENVRFLKGETKNAASLAKAYASLGDLFVNEAFADSHRAHASITGIASYLPSVAGPSLLEEVAALERALKSPKRPLYAIVGGAKLSSKIGVVKTLLRMCDTVFIGGALAHPFYRVMGHTVGKSKMEKGVVEEATRLLKNKKLVLPTDALVASSISNRASVKNVSLDQLTARDTIGDIGVHTMKAWTREIQKAKTIIWNGPLGAHEYSPFAHGSDVIAHAVARRSTTKSVFGVVGGGDTLPILDRLKLADDVDHVSTGGGAMLEFITQKGKLPALLALQKQKKKR